MTNGEKFKEVFGFGADGSRVIAVNATWWDSKFQNSKLMSDELVKRLRDAATMSEALAVLLPHSEGNATANLYKEAADAIETLHAADVRPNIHGKWLREYNPAYSPFDDSGEYCYHCNQCGCFNHREDAFCPNCGADMREES